MKKYLILFTGCLLFITNLLAQDTPSFVKDSLDTYVERALRDWQIPGVAVCVVKDGKVYIRMLFNLQIHIYAIILGNNESTLVH